MSLMTLHCPECREERLFERPYPAAERHGDAQRDDLAEYPDGDGSSGECSEFACVECGTALFTGFALPIMVGIPERTRSRRYPPGRAA